MQTINLKEADNQKILSLKISSKHLAAIQQISSKNFKTTVYNLEKENKKVFENDEIKYQFVLKKDGS